MGEKWLKEARKLTTYIVEGMPRHLDLEQESLPKTSETAVEQIKLAEHC
ncbi:hypothetical protein F383_33962 [Gossypium arboreum]|uniref:Uncharacterized protein n=1 Tax=Gossypium arboreum TaxID=29729 RepID=A0A0B0N6Q0_GOSAR|nr:hypothetical protein F383_33962 [Gossypium arboreum]